MPIDINAAGTGGTHTLRRVNVNTENDYIYFRDKDIPAAIVNGASYIYNSGIGAIAGLSEGELAYAKIETSQVLSLTTTSGGNIKKNLTDSTAGTTAFNTPVVYSNITAIGISTPTNQAVKYYTDSTPLTGLTSGNTYFLKNVESTFSGTNALYTITGNTHTFTSCGQTGRLGPNSAQIAAGYSTTWHGTYVTQGSYQGYQDWTVPVSGVYDFTVSGASGFEGSGGGTAGRGATVKGRVTLTKGEIITIAVGQRGNAPTANGVYGGSGGGTFVVRKTGNEPLFVAGGGTADSGASNGLDEIGRAHV